MGNLAASDWKATAGGRMEKRGFDVGTLGSGGEDLRKASLATLRNVFQNAASDVGLLGTLMDALKIRSDDAALDLECEVALALATARKSGAIDRRDALGPFFADRHLTGPDGRALHRYRATSDEFQAFRHHLAAAHKSDRLQQAGRDRDAAIFVLYGAEWFRRYFAGGTNRWQDLTGDIGALTHQMTADLTRKGLAWWKRKIRRSGDANEYLLTLRLEAGFPSQVLEARERSWLHTHLRRLIGLCVGMRPASDKVTEHALADGHVPETFRTLEFATLCAELAVAIADLRRQHGATAESSGLPLSAWLDIHEAGWRDALGIEGGGAAQLIDGLVSDSLGRLGSAARCRRLLVRHADGWNSALDLGVEGEPALPAPLSAERARLHAFPAGRLADVLTGAVCTLEPPTEDGGWLSRPRAAAPSRPVLDFLFEWPVLLELRSEGRSLGTITWSHGEAIRSDVLSFAPEHEDDGKPDVLLLLASGSCRSRREALYVLAPTGYRVSSAADSSTTDPIWSGGGRSLFRVTTSTHVGPPGEDLSFRIEPGAGTDEADQLVVKGKIVSGLRTPAGEPVYAGVPAISTRSGPIERPVAGDVEWRPLGQGAWHRLQNSLPQDGAIEVMWRDRVSRAARDRQRLVIMPPSTLLTALRLPTGAARFVLKDAGQWGLGAVSSAEARITDRTRDADETSWTIAWSGVPQRMVGLRLTAPGRAAIDLIAVFPFGMGRFLRSDGTALPERAEVTLEDLRGASAVADGKATLWMEARGPEVRSYPRQTFYDELPLWSLRDAVLTLLATTGSLDAEVRMSFESGGSELRVKRFSCVLRHKGGGLRLPVLPEVVEPVALCWRSFVDMGPKGVRALRTFESGVACSRQVVQLPPDLPGPGIAYLCSGPTVLSRPAVIDWPPLPEAPDLSALKRATLISRQFDRHARLDAELKVLGLGGLGSDRDLVWLHALLGLPEIFPPSTFDVVDRLVRQPAVLALLAASATTEAARERAWNLEREHPFLWVLVGIEDWCRAFTVQRKHLRSMLDAAGLSSDAERIAAETLRRAAETFAGFDDALRVPLWLAGLLEPPAPTRTLQDIAHDHVAHRGDCDDVSGARSCFHTPALIPRLRILGAWLDRFSAGFHEFLEAPLVAALHSTDTSLPLDDSQKLRIRWAKAQDPQYFNEAYGAVLRILAGAAPR